MEKGVLYLIEDDLASLYDFDERIEQYLALFASFDEWCKQASDRDSTLDQ